MPNDYIDFESDSRVLAPTDGTTDATLAFVAADNAARSDGKRKVKLNTNRTYAVDQQTAAAHGLGSNVIAPTYAHHWLGDRYNTKIVLKPGASKSQSITFWYHGSGHDGSVLEFLLNAQAARQMGGMADHDASGNLQGFRIYGLRTRGISDVDVRVRVLNTRSISATGNGSVFAMQSFGGQGGHFWVEFDTDDGSIGSEGIVFQGKTPVGGDPWNLDHCRSNRMWRGMGCYNGWRGIVRDLIATNLSGPLDAKAPLFNGAHRIAGNAHNIESGNLGTDYVQIFGSKTTACDRFLVMTKSGTDVDIRRVDVNGGTSTNDGDSIFVSGASPTVIVADWFSDSPTSNVLQSSEANAAGFTFLRSKYRLRAGHVLLGGGVTLKANPPWDLTPGTGGVNTPPVLSAMTPADGATVTAGGLVVVSCNATDDSDTP